jgi:histone H3/H4
MATKQSLKSSGAKGSVKSVSIAPSKSTNKNRQQTHYGGRRRTRHRRTIIPVTLMHRLIKKIGTLKLSNSNIKHKIRVSQKAALMAAMAVEDIIDKLVRKASYLKDTLSGAITLTAEHVLVAFENWRDNNLSAPAAAKRFAGIYGCVNGLEFRRKATSTLKNPSHDTKVGSQALAAAMRAHKNNVAVDNEEDDDEDDDDDDTQSMKTQESVASSQTQTMQT